jgi:hypothetical protein
VRALKTSPAPGQGRSNQRANCAWVPALLLVSTLGLQAPPVLANDFPTLARVQYVEQCHRDNPGPPFEMRSKCSCALDHLAGKISYEEFETLKTASDAMSIGGERGGTLRDDPNIRPWIARLKELQSQAAKACFLAPPR